MSITKPKKPIPSKANLFCFRCQVKLGKILNRGTYCPICRRKICKKCLASPNLSNSIRQSSLSHQTLINYQLISQKTAFTPNDAQYNFGRLTTENITHTLTTKQLCKSHENICLHNDSVSLSNKNKSTEKSKNDLSMDVKDVNLNTTNQSNSVHFNQMTGELNEPNTHNKLNSLTCNQQVPKKTKRKNAGLYVKRATSNTADSSAARRYRTNLRSNTREQVMNCTKNLNSNKALSISCQELTQPNDQSSTYSAGRCTSEQILNHNDIRPNEALNDNFDKSASLPKFKSLNRLLNKLKRSNTVPNVNDIGKRLSLFNNPNRSNSLKNQYDEKSTTLWRRSSAKTIAVGHQIYMKTINLGKKSFSFRRHSSQSIAICKLKGICSFCCKKITNEKLLSNQTIGYSFNRNTDRIGTSNQIDNKIIQQKNLQTINQQFPVPPARKSNLVKANSQKDNKTMLIRPETQFIVQRCILEQSCSMDELNIKKLDQISDKDSGLQTNSLENLNQNSNTLKNHRATTLPKTSIPFMSLNCEKRGTLKVRSHIEMNEDGTFYVQDSDWEMTSESDHWQKSDQFSSISSAELNDMSCEYLRLNTNLCNDKQLKELSKEIEMDKSDTLCSRNVKLENECVFQSINDVNQVKHEMVLSKNEKSDKFKANDKHCKQKNSIREKKIDTTHQQKNLECWNNDKSFNELMLRNSNQLMKENRKKLNTNLYRETEIKAKTNSNKNTKINRIANCWSIYRASSVGENMNEGNLRTSKYIMTAKEIKRSLSETVLHFHDNDVNSADDELDEDEDEDEVEIKDEKLDPSDVIVKESADKKCDDSSNTSISYNNTSSYCLDTYSFKKEQSSKIPDHCIDFFSSDEQSTEQNRAIDKQILPEKLEISSPISNQCDDTMKTEDEIKFYSDDNLQDSEKYMQHNMIENEILNYSLHQHDVNDSINQNEFQSNDFKIEIVDPDNRLIQQQRHDITSLENLFSLETIQEQDEEDYSLKDQSSLQSNVQQSHQSPIKCNKQNVSSRNNLNNETVDNLSNLKLFDNNESNLLVSPVHKSKIDELKIEKLKDESKDELSSFELQNKSIHNQISSTKNNAIDGLVNNVCKKVCLDEDGEEDTSQDYKKFKTYMSDLSMKNEIDTTMCSESLDNDHFNSLSECTVDENVTIHDQKILMTNHELNRFPENQNNFHLFEVTNQQEKKLKMIKPKICKRNSLIKKDNSERIEKFEKKNNMLEINIESRSELSDLNQIDQTLENISLKTNLITGELDESGIHIDQFDESKKKNADRKFDLSNTNKLTNNKSSHLKYLKNSSFVDSRPPSEEHNRNEMKSTKLVKLINKDNRKDNESLEQLIKGKALYSADLCFNKRTNMSSESRLSNEEFNRRRRSYEMNSDLAKTNSNKPTLINLRQKSTNYLLNQSFNQLSDDDIARIKRELIRRSEERLARFELSISSRSNSNVDLNKSIVESITSSILDESLQNSMSHNYDLKKVDKMITETSDENMNEHENKRISRKELNDKWRDTFKRSDSLDSINSIKSINSMGSSTNDEIVNMKMISRAQIKSNNQIDYEERMSEDYNYLNNGHHVLEDQLMIEGEFRLIDNLIHYRSMEEVGITKNQMSSKINGSYSNDQIINQMQQMNGRKNSNREEDNYYDELIENSYVEISLMSNNGSPNNHTYKIISENENSYEFESDLSNSSEDEENEYISLKNDYSISNEHENFQLIEDNLVGEINEQKNGDKNLKSTDYLKYKSSSIIQRRKTFNEPTNQFSNINLPLKRSKSLSSDTLIENSKYSKNKLTINDKLSLYSKTSLAKQVNDNKSMLFNQLDCQKKHLHQLYKQHWKYRLRNCDGDINDYTSLFALDQQNLDRPHELLVAYEYKDEKNEIHVFVKECRNFGNLTDKFIKIYLLPDKQSKQRTCLQSNTIGHVNNLIESKSFSICSPVINKKFVFKCERLGQMTSSRTIFISVWKNRRSLLEKNYCLGELFLKVTKKDAKNKIENFARDLDNKSTKNLNFKFDLEDNTSKLFFNWLSLDRSFCYSGDFLFSIIYEANKNQLQVNVIECLNLLTKKRDLRPFNTYCKVELKRSNISFRKSMNDTQLNNREIENEIDLNTKNNNSKEIEKQVRFLVEDTVNENYIPTFSLIDSQKTAIIKNNLCPKYNKLFIFNDIEPDNLEQYGLEMTIWCQNLTPHCLAGVRLGLANHNHARMTHDLKPIEDCIKEEQKIWQQVLESKKSNNLITACLHLRPID